MASPYNNQFQQNLGNMPPLQTHHQHANKRPFSPPSYQQSPGAMSPNMGGIPPAKRQRLSPNPPSPSPYQSPFSTSPYATSPYATSPPGGQYLSLPQSPASAHPSQSFHQPQPYQHPADMNPRPNQGSMPPPKVPYSKTQDNSELEKANPRDMDVNNISDVLTGSGIDLRAEEDNLLHTFSNRSYGTSFNSQTSGTTISPHGSFNQWSQGAQNHGAFQGTGVLSQAVTKEQQEAELQQKHADAARAYSETSQSALTDPFLQGAVVRSRIHKKAYDTGVTLDLQGLFDKIPDTPQNVSRTVATGSNGESIATLQASSILNPDAKFADILSLITLAAEERIRSVLEDSFALAQGRQNTSHGIVPPNLADIASATEDTQTTTKTPINISKTTWEAPDSAISPMTVASNKQPPNAARLPTPPTDVAPTPQPTIAFPNHIAQGLKKRVSDDQKFEEARVAKRQKRLRGSASTPAEAPPVAPIAVPEKMTKKERDRLNKADQTEAVLHRKANETASMALGGKKKYSWMTGGGIGSGASTPSRLNTAVGTGSASGTTTPAQPQIDRALQGTRRTYGAKFELEEIGKKIQVRDIIHTLELDGKGRKTLAHVLAKLKNTDKDEPKPVEQKPISAR